MIRFRYSANRRPPAPAASLVLRHPRSGRELTGVAAQIDTAADRTLVPLRIAEALELNRIGEIEIGGVGGTVDLMSVYDLFIGFPSLPLHYVEVVAHADEPSILLGRDVLNRHRLILDGLNLAVEIE